MSTGAEFEFQVNDKTLTRLQTAMLKAQVADETAGAAQRIAAGYQIAVKEMVAGLAEQAGYDMPNAYNLMVDAKTMMMKVVEQVPDQAPVGLQNGSLASAER